MVTIAKPVPHALLPEAVAIAQSFKERFGADALQAALALCQLMLENGQSDRVTVYRAVIVILENADHLARR